MVLKFCLCWVENTKMRKVQVQKFYIFYFGRAQTLIQFKKKKVFVKLSMFMRTFIIFTKITTMQKTKYY